MKKLFAAIRKNDYQTLKESLEKNPELISCTSQGTPKKHDGQSLLQVALKTAKTEIIELLLDFGADVNFIEDDFCINDWRAPVIHDAINRAVLGSRWNAIGPNGVYVFSTLERSDEAYDILKRIIKLGADVNAKDSFGNSCIARACLQARQILPYSDGDDAIPTKELQEDLSRIFRLLIDSGADLNYVAPNSFGKTDAEFFGDEPVGIFLKP